METGTLLFTLFLTSAFLTYVTCLALLGTWDSSSCQQWLSGIDESIYSVLGGAGGNGALYFFKVSTDSDFSKQNQMVVSQRKEVRFNFQYCGGITQFSPQGNVTVWHIAAVWRLDWRRAKVDVGRPWCLPVGIPGRDNRRTLGSQRSEWL